MEDSAIGKRLHHHRYYQTMECFDRIESADVIVAVKKPNNTFGEGVTYELEYAKRLNRNITR